MKEKVCRSTSKLSLKKDLIISAKRMFIHDLTGNAEILTKKRRLTESIFDKLKYITNQ